MVDTYVPSLRDRALSAVNADLHAVEAHGAHERKRWVAIQRNRFVHQVGQLGHAIIPEMVELVEVGDGVHQELCHEVEGVLFRMTVDYQVHRTLTATLVCSYCGQGCVTARVDSLEDLGAAYERMAEHVVYCLDGLHRSATLVDDEIPEHERRGLNCGMSPDEWAAIEQEEGPATNRLFHAATAMDSALRECQEVR